MNFFPSSTAFFVEVALHNCPPPAESFRTNSGGHPHIDFVISTYQKTTFSHGKTKIKNGQSTSCWKVFEEWPKSWENPWRSTMKSGILTKWRVCSKRVGVSIESTSFNTQTLCRKSSFVYASVGVFGIPGGCWKEESAKLAVLIKLRMSSSGVESTQFGMAQNFPGDPQICERFGFVGRIRLANHPSCFGKEFRAWPFHRVVLLWKLRPCPLQKYWRLDFVENVSESLIQFW